MENNISFALLLPSLHLLASKLKIIVIFSDVYSRVPMFFIIKSFPKDFQLTRQHSFAFQKTARFEKDQSKYSE